MPPLIENSQIVTGQLLSPLPLYLHGYVWPFAVVWPIFMRYYLTPSLYDRYFQSPEWAYLWGGSLAIVQALVCLSTNWSVHLKAACTATGASIKDAQLIKVVPVPNAGSAEICRLVRENGNEISFNFQKRRFLFDPAKQSFNTIKFAIDSDPKPRIQSFLQSRGIENEAERAELEKYYGNNTFDIPVPTFTELFRQHTVAPFFVFQVICVGLWLLDSYLWYSLFTLFMLVVFESTVVWQRQRTLTEFRGMGIKPYDIWVYRLGKWTEVRSDKLLPRDLVSVCRTKEDSGVACDMLLVEGTAIVNEAMLSGESTPLLKESIQLRPNGADIDLEGLDKNAVLWGGTNVLQITHGHANAEKPPIASGVPPPPDNGAMAIVLKTGFETSQGSLVRTIIFATEHVSANNLEALFFILFLTVFAIAASWYVWDEGVRNDRKRSKLLLDCILIVTSVVPPELPMQLSLSVNTSLAALAKYAIFCTEPFRIPFGGRIDVACFDKTGTLTGEELVVEGIAGLNLSASVATVPNGTADRPDMTQVTDAGVETVLVLATAHALVKLDEGDIVGDPMERATLASLGWVLGKNDTLTNSSGGVGAKGRCQVVGSVQVKRRFQFSSSLKRQSSVATVSVSDSKTGKKVKGTFVGIKGAPETIMQMLVTVPPRYEETYKFFTRKGSRVLALAYKQLSTDNELGAHRINDLQRESVEKELHFAGFLVLHCPLKEDAVEAVRMLNESSHRVIMITGDNPLTAVHVARQVGIVDREVLILDAPEHGIPGGGDELVWRSVDDRISFPADPRLPIDPIVLRTKDLCVTGHALSRFHGQVGWRTLLRHAWVYARVSPKQKEEIVLGLKEMGYYTLMAGDGTNDVGALKQAHVGVALLNGTKADMVRMAEHGRNMRMKEIYHKQVELMKRFNQPAPPVPVLIAHFYPPGPTNPHYEAAIGREAQKKGVPTADYAKAIQTVAAAERGPAPAAVAMTALAAVAAGGAGGAGAGGPKAATQDPRQARRVETANKAASLATTIQNKLLESELLQEGEAPVLKLGDASVAAPFTSKLRDVMAIPNIIRQGRCTLVATIQMYKILALTCLITAYSLSVLYLEGIKFGDTQYTISGMLMSVCFLSISRARSVEGLSRERPQPNIFNVYIIGSILGQFAVHIATLIYVARLCERLEPHS